MGDMWLSDKKDRCVMCHLDSNRTVDESFLDSDKYYRCVMCDFDSDWQDRWMNDS